ncbi:MAG: PDZ domain-containing protein [Polyangiaceae bacterium]
MSSGRLSAPVAQSSFDASSQHDSSMSPWARVALGAFASVALLAGSAGCGRRDTPPQLLNLTEVAPRVIDASEAFEIQGSGLPSKAHAKVTLVGSIHQPGRPALTNQALELEGESTPTSISVTIPSAVRSQLLGSSDEGLHVTFHGSVQVAFPPVTPGALAITGSLQDITLDVRPVGVRPSVLSARTTEGDRALKWLGISVTDEPAPAGGLVVTDVAEGSPAEAAGLIATDTIVSLDGLTLLDRGDVAPSGRERFSTMVIHHQGDATPLERLIALQGYKPVSGGNPDLLGAGLLLGAAALVILFFASPGAFWLTRLDRRIAAHGAQRKAGRSLLAWVFERATSAWRAPSSEVSISRSTLASAVFVALSALLSLLPFGGAVMGFEIDIGSIAAALLIVQVATHFVQWAQALEGGDRRGSKRCFARCSLHCRCC